MKDKFLNYANIVNYILKNEDILCKHTFCRVTLKKIIGKIKDAKKYLID